MHILEVCLRLTDKISEKLIRVLKLEERFPRYMTTLQLKLNLLHGPHANVSHAKRRFCRTVSWMVLLVLCSLGAGLISGDASLCTAGAVLAGFVPIAALHRLDEAVKEKKRAILRELPELLSKLTLLVNAGETVQGAIGRSLDSGREDSVLYRELRMTVNEFSNGISFPTALENFSKRCGVQEAAQFSNTILLNYRRGGEDFVTSLRELNRSLWEKRKGLAKTLGEEASSKLVFPMVVIFLVVTVIVAAPAIMFMNQF